MDTQRLERQALDAKVDQLARLEFRQAITVIQRMPNISCLDLSVSKHMLSSTSHKTKNILEGPQLSWQALLALIPNLQRMPTIRLQSSSRIFPSFPPADGPLSLANMAIIGLLHQTSNLRHLSSSTPLVTHELPSGLKLQSLLHLVRPSIAPSAARALQVDVLPQLLKQSCGTLRRLDLAMVIVDGHYNIPHFGTEISRYLETHTFTVLHTISLGKSGHGLGRDFIAALPALLIGLPVCKRFSLAIHGLQNEEFKDLLHTLSFSKGTFSASLEKLSIYEDARKSPLPRILKLSDVYGPFISRQRFPALTHFTTNLYLIQASILQTLFFVKALSNLAMIDPSLPREEYVTQSVCQSVKDFGRDLDEEIEGAFEFPWDYWFGYITLYADGRCVAKDKDT